MPSSTTQGKATDGLKYDANRESESTWKEEKSGRTSWQGMVVLLELIWICEWVSQWVSEWTGSFHCLYHSARLCSQHYRVCEFCLEQRVCYLKVGASFFFSVVSPLNREQNREISKWSGVVELASFEVIFIGREKRQLSETQGIHKTQA